MKPFIEAFDLHKTFVQKKGWFKESKSIHAVNGVSVSIAKGETLGLVGESGCGKSTLGRCLIKLMKPTSGSVFFENNNLLTLTSKQMKPFRRRMQIIFQDPYSSLNPRLTVGSILEEPLIIHRICATASERRNKLRELLEKVGLPNTAASSFPHEFSGGQRQRIGIARAISLSPDFIVCDEPVSALDVSIQAQIVNLLTSLQEEMSLTYLFISHDLRVVHHVSNRVAVMYLGKIVEEAPKSILYDKPLHPYTKALFSSMPALKPRTQREKPITGEAPSTVIPPIGCAFHPRCPIAVSKCRTDMPSLKGTMHKVSCFLVEGE